MQKQSKTKTYYSSILLLTDKQIHTPVSFTCEVIEKQFNQELIMLYLKTIPSQLKMPLLTQTCMHFNTYDLVILQDLSRKEQTMDSWAVTSCFSRFSDWISSSSCWRVSSDSSRVWFRPVTHTGQHHYTVED